MGLEPTASLDLDQGGLPFAYRTNLSVNLRNTCLGQIQAALAHPLGPLPL